MTPEKKLNIFEIESNKLYIYSWFESALKFINTNFEQKIINNRDFISFWKWKEKNFPEICPRLRKAKWSQKYCTQKQILDLQKKYRLFLKELRKEKKIENYCEWYFFDKNGKKLFFEKPNHDKMILAYFENFPNNFFEYQQKCTVSVFYDFTFSPITKRESLNQEKVNVDIENYCQKFNVKFYRSP